MDLRRLFGACVIALLTVGIAASCGGDGAPEGDVAAYCDRILELNETDPFSDALDSNDPSSAIGAFAEELRSLSELAPSEIRQDVQQFRRVFVDVQEAIDANGGDLAAAGEALADLDLDELDQIGDRLDEFEAANCT